MLNVNTIALLRTISGTVQQVVNVLGYYIYNGDGGGRFYWDGTSTATDDGGSVIQPTGVAVGRWYRIFNGYVSVKYFGAVGDDVHDDTIAITNAWNYCHNNTINLNFPMGIFKITSVISNYVNGYSIIGVQDKTTIKGNYGYNMMTLYDAQNGGIYGIRFVNNYVNSVSGYPSVLFIVNCDLVNFTIQNCYFTNPYCNATALFTQINTTISDLNQIDNFRIINNVFENIGSSAYATFNRNENQSKQNNVVFNNNTAINLGLLDTYGFFATFEGSGQYVQICNNDCTNAKGIGFEIGSYKGVILSNNIFNNDSTNFYVPYCLNGTQNDNLLPPDGNKCELNIISNNVCNNTAAPYYYYAENCNITNNIYVFDDSLNVNNPTIAIRNSNNNIFSNEQYIAKYKCVQLEKDITYTALATCENNMFSNCIFTANGDNTESGLANYGIVFYNGADNNFVNNSNFLLGNYLLTNEPIVEFAGSNGNIGSNNIFNDVIVNYP